MSLSEGKGRVLNDRQTDLARHALGLPNRWNETYRNHFVCGPGGSDHAEWMQMVTIGAAIRRDGTKLPYGGDDLFHLTRDGAAAALDSDERLRDEDFQ